MDNLIFLILGAGLCFIAYTFLPSCIKQLSKKNTEKITECTEQDEVASKEQTKPVYSQSYQRKYLLTKNEWHEYKKLKQYAERMNLQICPKVRLLDIIEPRRGTQNYMSLLGKIQSKHIDFLICDQNLYIKAILELDDNSHNRPDRQERDYFVDDILTSVGYKVIRTRSITEDTLKSLSDTVPQEQMNIAT